MDDQIQSRTIENVIILTAHTYESLLTQALKVRLACLVAICGVMQNIT